jgi:hypothetical protein
MWKLFDLSSVALLIEALLVVCVFEALVFRATEKADFADETSPQHLLLIALAVQYPAGNSHGSRSSFFLVGGMVFEMHPR